MSSACKWEAKRTGPTLPPNPSPHSNTPCSLSSDCLCRDRILSSSFGNKPTSCFTPSCTSAYTNQGLKSVQNMIPTYHAQCPPILIVFSMVCHPAVTFLCFVTVLWMCMSETGLYFLSNRKLGQANLACLHIPLISKVSEAHIGKEGSTSCRQIHIQCRAPLKDSSVSPFVVTQHPLHMYLTLKHNPKLPERPGKNQHGGVIHSRAATSDQAVHS